MSSPIRRVAVAGATGSLGRPVIAALVKAGYQVTALTRDATKASLPSGVEVVSVDYASEASLRTVLQGQDALISTLAADGTTGHHTLFDAAIAAGVRRVIPSEFGSDLSVPEVRALPCYAGKIALRDHIREKVAGTSTTYTLIVCNVFLDYCLEHNVFFDRYEKKVQYFDGGNNPFTVTPLETVADGVIGVLRHLDETANRTVRIHGRAITQRQLLALYQKHSTTEGWQTTEVDTKELVESAYEVLHSDPSNMLGWLYPMIFRAALGKGLPVDYSSNNDNDLVGVKTIDDDKLEAYVKAAVV